jgi:hypothetical protein
MIDIVHRNGISVSRLWSRSQTSPITQSAGEEAECPEPTTSHWSEPGPRCRPPTTAADQNVGVDDRDLRVISGVERRVFLLQPSHDPGHRGAESLGQRRVEVGARHNRAQR